MPDRATVTLTAAPASGRKARRRRQVVVRTLTLGRFIALMVQATSRIGEFVAKSAAGAWDFGAWVLSWTPEDKLLLMAIACPGELPSKLRPYLTDRNLGRILEAMGETNDVDRLVRSINLDRQAPRAGSIDADVVAICRQFPGLTPPEVRAWAMTDFLDTCDGLRAIDALTATRPAERPASSAVLGMIPGVGVN